MTKKFETGEWVGWKKNFGQIKSIDYQKREMEINCGHCIWSVKRIHGRWLAYRSYQGYGDRISRLNRKKIERTILKRAQRERNKLARAIKNGEYVCINACGWFSKKTAQKLLQKFLPNIESYFSSGLIIVGNSLDLPLDKRKNCFWDLALFPDFFYIL